MKINFIPIDNRPITYNLTSDIISINENIELFMPDIKDMGGLITNANVDNILNRLNNSKSPDLIVLTLDTVAYGGLVSSRRCKESFFDIKKRLDKLEEILLSKKRENKNLKVFATSSVMRISNNNVNEEEKEYWADFGEKIFEYSYYTHKNKAPFKTDIPDEILSDYLNVRKRNFEINKIYIDFLKNGIFDYLVFSKDDTGEFGLNVMEAEFLEKELLNLNGKVKTGADEIPLALLTRGIVQNENIKIKPVYRFFNSKNLISKYEDISVEECTKAQIELLGLKIDEDNPDIILYVNNFKKTQGDCVFQDVVNREEKHNLDFDKPFIIADINNSNGSDTGLVEKILSSPMNPLFLAYSGYNTSANSIGSALSFGVMTYLSKKKNAYNDKAHKKLLAIRFLDDYAYQAILRKDIQNNFNLEKFQKLDFTFYEEKINKFLNADFTFEAYSPWKRSFEAGFNLK